MRNAKQKEKTFNDLPDRQRAFAQLVVQGMTYEAAYIQAGYLNGKNPKLEYVKKSARCNGSMLASKPLIKAYIARNRALAYEPEEYSLDMVKARMRQIMSGDVAIPYTNHKGEKALAYPQAKDMVSAGKLLFDILRYENAKPKASVGEFELDEDILDKSTSFLKDFASNAKSKTELLEENPEESPEESPIEKVGEDE